MFIHNLGHATAAYLGYHSYPESTFLYEVLSDSQIIQEVRNTMLQAANILLKKYPDDFTIESLTAHIDDLLKRFQNISLGDTIFRVGCDQRRKLGKEDRLSGAIHLARDLKLPYDLILKALVCACHFQASHEFGIQLPSDIEFAEIYANGIKAVLSSICGFDEIIDCDAFREAAAIDNLLKID